MKRILPILLMLLLLCGCGVKQTEQPQESTQPTEPAVVSTYLSGSDLEQQTAGAVRQYDITGQKIDWIASFNGGVLAAAAAGSKTTLWVISGMDGEITATTTIPAKLTAKSVWQTTDGGFVYYAVAEKQVVFLDDNLNAVKQLQLPDTMTGDPAIAPDGSTIYYCAGQTVHGMDTELKITRPVRTNTCEEQTLLDCYLDGAVVACSVRDRQDSWNTLYISGEDGRLLYTENGLQQIYCHENAYFALRKDGTTNQYIFGNTDNAAMQLNIPDEAAYGVLELGGVVGQIQTEDSIQLSFYNMKKTASVALPAEKRPIMAAADGTDQGIWLLTSEGTLLRWSIEKSAVTDETDYIGPVYTAGAPDTEGLAQCAARADALGKEVGVVFRVYERALVSNDDYNIEVEYQTHAINRALDALESQLRRFPAKFLYKSVSGQIRICIVRSIGGEVTSAYHWHDGDPFIILSAGMNVEEAFLDAFAYILDIHVLGNSSMADGWESLNPAGFAYGAETTVMAYLEGETRAFADRRGMHSVTDDRASVFYQAMLAENADVFRSETMQAKLRMLCQAIRDAWRLEQSAEVFPWEQYLNA